MNQSKFQVYDFSGKVRNRFVVNQRSLTTAVPKVTKKHHIMIVDRSGSMYYCMNDLKESLKKILALHEYMDESMLVSLVSYSSKGDMTVHFQAKPVSSIKPSEIDQLRATNMTCISQSLQMIRGMIDKNHATGITLHSDGFANDPSSFTEKTAIFDACAQLAKENVFVNTVAHSDYADFQLLSAVANKVSGRCVKVNGVKQLYDSIVDTFNVLKSGASAVSHVDLNSDDYLLYVSPSDGRIIGGASGMDLAAVDPSNPGNMYGLKGVDEKTYNADPVPEEQASPVVYAFARAKLAEGNINMAKYTLASIANVELFETYWRASSSSDLAKLANALEEHAFGKATKSVILSKPIVIKDTVTVLDVLSTMDKFKGAFVLSVDKFLKGYDRRGVKRINGERDENGNLTEPWLELDYPGDKTRAAITGIEVSTTSANVSINVIQKCRLIKKADRTPITQVAGLMVDSLTSFRSYTIIGDGELTVSDLPVYISDKKAFEALVNLGVVYDGQNKASKATVIMPDGTPKNGFDFNTEYRIVLNDLPITKINVDSAKMDDVIKKIFLAKILGSLFNSVVKEESATLTAEQIAELKKHYLSKNMNINFPTTTSYVKLEDAISAGKVDVRSSFKIRFGTNGIYGADSFRSANDFIERMYAPIGAVKGDEYDCSKILEMVQWTEKSLSAKSKSTVADALQKQVFDYILLGKSDSAGVENFLKEAKADAAIKAMQGKVSTTKDWFVKAFSDSAKAIEKYSQELYMENMFPVTFYVGSFGMAPDEWNSPVLSADAVKKQWPDAKIGKNEADGLFFKTGETVFGITAEKRYVSIE